MFSRIMERRDEDRNLIPGDNAGGRAPSTLLGSAQGFISKAVEVVKIDDDISAQNSRQTPSFICLSQVRNIHSI